MNNETFFLTKESKKVASPATKKQYDYLNSFKNVTCEISVSQFLKYIDRDEASDAIDAAKQGRPVVIE